MKLLIDIPEHIYEHAKESSEDSMDEFDAMRAIANGTQQESSSEIPNTCEDAISRQAVLNGLASIAKAKAKSDAQKSLMGRVMFFTERLPPVTPQQRTGRWIIKDGKEQGYDIAGVKTWYIQIMCNKWYKLMTYYASMEITSMSILRKNDEWQKARWTHDRMGQLSRGKSLP